MARGGSGRRRAEGPCNASRLAAVALLLLLIMPLVATGTDSLVADEDHLKATFVLKLAGFVEWPAASGGKGPLLFCVLGRSSLGAALSEIILERGREQPAAAVRQIDSLGGLDDCRVLFVGADERERLDPILGRAGQQLILTIGESADFAVRGGMITLVERNRRLAFEINRGAAERSGLRMRSQLLGLATVVERPDRSPEAVQ